MKTTTTPEQQALAKSMNVPISTKHSVEISNHLRYKTTSYAKQFLTEVVALRSAVPFKRFINDLGHKPGIGPGRYPKKAAAEFLRLVKSVEANAQNKGLSTSSLKITKLLANKASIPSTGGRRRRGTKRTHLEIEVCEFASKKKSDKKTVKKEQPVVAPEPVKEVKQEEKVTPVVEEAKGVVEPVKETSIPEAKQDEKSSEVKKEEKVVEEKVTPVVEEAKGVVVEEPVNVPVKEPEQVSESRVEEEPKVEDQPAPKEEPKKVVVEEKVTPVVEEAKKVIEPVKESPVEEPVKEVVPETEIEKKEVPTPKIVPVEELSSEELLKQAQAKAATLNRKQEKDHSVEEVENLYEQLKQKGSLRKGGSQ